MKFNGKMLYLNYPYNTKCPSQLEHFAPSSLFIKLLLVYEAMLHAKYKSSGQYSFLQKDEMCFLTHQSTQGM
jgi:hypothetical protein